MGSGSPCWERPAHSARKNRQMIECGAATERATPIIEAIGVTDYYVTDTYEQVRKHIAAARLPAVKLVFPNVELRAARRLEPIRASHSGLHRKTERITGDMRNSRHPRRPQTFGASPRTIVATRAATNFRSSVGGGSCPPPDE